jgi:hypothetical protein
LSHIAHRISHIASSHIASSHIAHRIVAYRTSH